MKNYVISSNGEDWSEECYGTREEVIQAGIEEWMGDIFWVGEARPPEPPENFFDAWIWLDDIQEHDDYNLPNETYHIYAPKLKDLQDFVGLHIKKFIADNNLQPTHFVVDNVEKIDPEKL